MFTAENCLHRMYEAPYRMLDPGDTLTIYPREQFSVCPVVTAAAETRTLEQPSKAGIIHTIVLDTDGGDLTLTVTGGYNADAATSITLADAGDFVTFISVKVGASYYWRVLASEGTTVAGEDMTVDQLTAGTVTVTTGIRMVVASVTAVGSVQSLATNTLSEGFNIVADGGTNLGLLLPVAANGAEVIIKNNSGSTVIVYGSVTADIINALATTTGFSVATTKTARFIRENSTRWWTDPLAVA